MRTLALTVVVLSCLLSGCIGFGYGGGGRGWGGGGGGYHHHDWR
jgi:hypothetical protein